MIFLSNNKIYFVFSCCRNVYWCFPSTSSSIPTNNNIWGSCFVHLFLHPLFLEQNGQEGFIKVDSWLMFLVMQHIVNIASFSHTRSREMNHQAGLGLSIPSCHLSEGEKNCLWVWFWWKQKGHIYHIFTQILLQKFRAPGSLISFRECKSANPLCLDGQNLLCFSSCCVAMACLLLLIFCNITGQPGS